jgi:hypothetical protein
MKIFPLSWIISIFEKYFSKVIQIFGSRVTHGKTAENIKSDCSKFWLISDNIHDIQ